MKKILSLALAVAMIMSMSSIAFAVTMVGENPDATNTTAVQEVWGPFGYKSKDSTLSVPSALNYGSTYYYVLTKATTTGANPVTEAIEGATGDIVKGIRTKQKWDMGKTAISTVEVVSKKVSNGGATPIGGVSFPSAGKYYTFLTIKIPEPSKTADTDVYGTITLSKSSNTGANGMYKFADLECGIEFCAQWKDGIAATEMESEKRYLFDFENEDDYELNFEDGSYFEVNTSSQGKIVVGFDNLYNDDIAAKYPAADLTFWNGNGARFNRTGELYIDFDEEGCYIYELKADGTLAAIPSAVYDQDGFVINTKTIGSYVISDIALDVSASSEPTEPTDPAPTDPTTPTPVVPNPGTGAAL